jgi:hypothetical protein
MAFEQPLQHLTGILEQMEAVGNLHRIGGTPCSAISILGCAITANHLNAGMVFEPLLQNRRRSFRQEVARLMLVEIHEDGAVELAFTERKVVHAQVTRSGAIRRWGASHQAQEGIRTDGHPLPLCSTGTRFAADIQAQLTLLSGQTDRAAGKRRDDGR